MEEAGIENVFKPHSIRGASTSSVLKSNSVEDVMSSVGWASESTVARLYNKPIDSFNSGEELLKNV
jgi:hypothetical protein